jgi:hypothetical protein
VLRQRWTWFEGQIALAPDRLVFVDESWASTNMARRYCRPRGERLRMSVPHGPAHQHRRAGRGPVAEREDRDRRHCLPARRSRRVNAILASLRRPQVQYPDTQ